MKTFTVYQATNGAQHTLQAENWREAVRQTGRDDACVIEWNSCKSLDVMFDVDYPKIITCLQRDDEKADAASLIGWALKNVAQYIEASIKADQRHAELMEAV